MNGYGRLSAVRNLMNGQNTTAQDDDILRAIRQATAAARTQMGGRQYHSTIETAYFSGHACRELWLGRDLLSITTLKVADTADQPSTFETTLAAGTDYTLWPRNAAAQGEPYRKIILNPAGQLSTFPLGVDNVQLVGKFGHSEILELVGTTAEALDDSETGIDLVDGHTVEEGDTLFIDSEQVYVSGVASNTITVVRAINGSTAAAHDTAKAVYLRRYAEDVTRAVEADASRYVWRASQGFAESGFREMWPMIAATLDSSVDPAAVL